MIAGEKEQADENKEKCSLKDEAWTRNSSMFRHKMFFGNENENEVILCRNVDLLCACASSGSGTGFIRCRGHFGPFLQRLLALSTFSVFRVLFRLPFTNSSKTTVQLFICRRDDVERGKGTPERTAYRTMDLSNYRSIEL